MISVLIADDQALLRAGFRLLIDSTPDLHVVGEAVDGQEATDLCHELNPDIALMDVRMPGVDGIEATRHVCDNTSLQTRVLILTTFDLDEYVYAGLRAGASGFLLKDTKPEDLLAAIRLIAAGEALLAPSVTRRLITEFANRPHPPPAQPRALNGITDRERDVLTLVGQGLSNTEISQHLHISAATTKTHISRLLAKLGARDRAQLVIAAYEADLVRAGTVAPTCPNVNRRADATCRRPS